MDTEIDLFLKEGDSLKIARNEEDQTPILASITKVNSDGSFVFWCENGGWEGTFSVCDQTVLVHETGSVVPALIRK